MQIKQREGNLKGLLAFSAPEITIANYITGQYIVLSNMCICIYIICTHTDIYKLFHMFILLYFMNIFPYC